MQKCDCKKVAMQQNFRWVFILLQEHLWGTVPDFTKFYYIYFLRIL